MGQLEVVFKIGLGYPLHILDNPPDKPVVISFHESGNTVTITP